MRMIAVLALIPLLALSTSVSTVDAAPAPAVSGGKIVGVVTIGTHKVEGANVVLLAPLGVTVDQTTSDYKGRYGFSGVAAGSYQVLATKVINGNIYSGVAPATVTGNGRITVNVNMQFVGTT